MDSPLSSIVADLVLQHLETRAINMLFIWLPIYYRYVDDIFLACSCELLDNVLEIFNSLYERIQFTVEVGESNRLNFLDVTAIISDKKIIFDYIRNRPFPAA